MQFWYVDEIKLDSSPCVSFCSDAIVQSYKSRLDAALMQHFPELAPHLQEANTNVDHPVKTEPAEDTKPVITNGTNFNSNANGNHYGQPSR